jgi:hypothetical protein
MKKMAKFSSFFIGGDYMRFLTGPEIHLAIAIWCFGAACGIGWFTFLWSIDKKKNNKK